MSLPIGEYRCSGCSFVQTEVHQEVRLRYVLEDGRYGTGYRQAGWCPACNKVVEVERLPDASTVIRKLAEAERTARGTTLERLLDRLGRDPSVDQRHAKRSIEEHRGTLAWLEQRRSRPRCLKCGTEEVVTHEHDPAGALHHSCGGVLELVHPESGKEIRVSMVPICHVMSVDGLILRTERDDERDDEDWLPGFLSR
jgi:hypothetical protein